MIWDYFMITQHWADTFIQISGTNPKHCSLVCHCQLSQDFLIFLLCLCTTSHICWISLCHFIIHSHSVIRLFLLQFFNWLTQFLQWTVFHCTDYSICRALKNIRACRISPLISSCNKHLMFYCFLLFGCPISLKVCFMGLNSSLLEI